MFYCSHIFVYNMPPKTSVIFLGEELGIVMVITCQSSVKCLLARGLV